MRIKHPLSAIAPLQLSRVFAAKRIGSQRHCSVLKLLELKSAEQHFVRAMNAAMC